MTRKTLLAAGCVAALASAIACAAPGDPSANRQTGDRASTRAVGPWNAPAGLPQVPIWPRTPPDDDPSARPESVMTARTPEALEGGRSQAVFDVTRPTMTVFPARGRSTRAAIVVFPGGGFNAVVITSEGTEICRWLTERGVTCVLSKYRVPRTGHHYDKDCDCGVEPNRPRALQDAQRTIRLVRSRARELGIDPTRIGAMGFSAGGYLVVQTSNILEPGYRSVDAIDRVSSRPDFAIALYPGHLCRPGRKLDPGIRVSAQTPPTFLAQAWDDSVDDVCNTTLYARALDDARVPAEVHLFAKGGHAFTLRRTGAPTDAWPTLLETWLRGIGVMHSFQPSAKKR